MRWQHLQKIAAPITVAALLLFTAPAWAQRGRGGGRGHVGGGVAHFGGGGRVGGGRVGGGRVGGGRVGGGISHFHAGGGRTFANRGTFGGGRTFVNRGTFGGRAFAGRGYLGRNWNGGYGRYGYYRPYRNYGYYGGLGSYPWWGGSTYPWYSTYPSYGYSYPSYYNYYDYGYPGYYDYGDSYSPYYDYYSPYYIDTDAAVPVDTAVATTPAAAANQVLVTVDVPVPDAEIWCNGVKMTETGTVRQFVSPPITPGMDYTYDLRARWMEQGAVRDETRHLDVHAGDRVTVDFTHPQ